VIFAVENSNKFQKTMFWKEKLVEDMVTLGPTPQATLVRSKHAKLGQKNNPQMLKNKNL
jgi:hypothetical protein